MIPKTGCSTWKTLFVNISGFVAKPGQRVPVHGHAINRYGYRYLNQYSMSDRKKIVSSKDYFKFIIVRNPFDRLVSAHRNKFIEIKYRKDIISRIKERFRNNPQDMEFDVQFEEFVTFLSDSYPSGKDMHWERFEELCQPCSISYDFVLKLETVDSDLPLLLEKILKSKSELTSVPIMNRSSNSTGPSSYKPLHQFKNIPENILRQLMEVYEFDFNAFGYSFDTETESATCGQRNTDSPKCC